MTQKFLHRTLLYFMQLTLKRDMDVPSCLALVIHLKWNVGPFQVFAERFPQTARQGNVTIDIFAEIDEPCMREIGEMHRLVLVEHGIMKRRESANLVLQARRKI